MCVTRARSSGASRHSRAASNGGLIITGSAPAAVHRDLIITLAARHQLPAVYPFRFYVDKRRTDLLRG